MADNNLNQVVLDALRQANGNAAGGGSSGDDSGSAAAIGGGFSSALTDASRQIDALRSANQALAEVVRSNTQAVTQNSASQSGGKSAASTIGSVASSIFGSGLGLVPLITSLAHLFGGGKIPEPAPTLLPYAAPALRCVWIWPIRRRPIRESQDSRRLSYGQNGLPRVSGRRRRGAVARRVRRFRYR